MKEIKAIVQRFVAPRVLDELQQLHELPGVTVSDVTGFGRKLADGTGKRNPPEEAPMTKLEIVVPDRLADEVVRLIASAGHTGHPGDGKIFVLEVEDVVRIRTGERGEDAI